MTCITCNKDKPIRRRGQCARCCDMHLPYEQTALTGGTWKPGRRNGWPVQVCVPNPKPVKVGGRVVGVAP